MSLCSKNKDEYSEILSAVIYSGRRQKLYIDILKSMVIFNKQITTQWFPEISDNTDEVSFVRWLSVDAFPFTWN